MNIIWNEAHVRDELKCIDQKTGFCGADIPIVFNNAKRTLESFSTHIMARQNSFAFQITIFRIRIFCRRSN